VTAVPAAVGELAPLRHRFSDWLSELGLETVLFHNVVIAVGEAAVNAVEHGSGLDGEKTISVEAFASGTALTVTVSDTGQWRADSAASRRTLQRGRGLTLMHGLSDRVDTVRSRRGTTVTLAFPRTRPPDPAATMGGQP
jgi:anti-sigma regulatory factor (Ser/Thr protein kinase)